MVKIMILFLSSLANLQNTCTIMAFIFIQVSVTSLDSSSFWRRTLTGHSVMLASAPYWLVSL